MRVKLYEVPEKTSTFGDESFLKEYNFDVVPRVGEMICTEDNLGLYRVVDLSHCFGYDENDNETYEIDLLVVKD